MTLPRGVTQVALAPATPTPPRDHGGVTATVIAPDGGSVTLPCFVQDDHWCVRFRSPEAGTYRISTDAGHAVEHVVDCGEPTAAPVLTRSGRHLASPQGPFLWTADTWWFALCDRVSRAELVELADLRREQGFTVVHLVAGLLPEVDPFEALGELVGRWPWTAGFADLDPAWWEEADERLTAIADAGLVAAVVGAWSYYLLDLGEQRMRRHWREVVARWAAFPVVWCVAGEAGLPHYAQVADPAITEIATDLARRWRPFAAHVRALDGYRNLRTVHPWPGIATSSTETFGDVTDLDLVWLQTGHLDRSAIAPSLDTLTREVAADHARPVINSEVCYEGIAAGSHDDLQRFLFWSHLLSGAAGHSYGAQGLWAFRRAEDPGPGARWGETTWPDAVRRPGSAQVGHAAELLRTLPWSDLRPAPSALDAHAGPDHWQRPYAAVGPDDLVAYVPAASLLEPGVSVAGLTVRGLAAGRWVLRWWNPRRGVDDTTFEVAVGDDGAAVLPTALPSIEDWVLVGRRDPRENADSRPR